MTTPSPRASSTCSSERIRRRTYKTRKQARQDIFDYIEMFYNPKRKHARNEILSPVDVEKRQRNVNQEGV